MIITLPANFVFTSVESFKLQRATNIIRSKFTGQAQKITYPFAVWMLNAKLQDYVNPEAAAIRSFLAQLDGQVNSFRLPVPGYSNPSTGYVKANIAVSIAGLAGATSLTLKNMGANILALNAGDFFTINDELKIATSPLQADATGIGTVNFEPPLRKAAAINAIVTINNPWCLMCAADDDIADWAIKPPIIHAFNFQAVEDI